MKKIVVVFVCILNCTMCTKLMAQITPVWATAYTENYPFSIRENGMITDVNGNVYITGYINDTGQVQQAITLKYDNTGYLQWSRIIDSIGGYTKIVMDDSSNIYIIGESVTESLKITKYNSSGTLLWSKSYFGGGEVFSFFDMVVDDSSSVYLTGPCTDEMFRTAKVNKSGSLIWLATDSIANGSSNSYIQVDKNRNVYAVGRGGDTVQWVYLFKYNNAGVKQWVRYYSGNYTPGNAFPCDLKCDDKYVYVLAATRNNNNGEGDYAVVKYDFAGNQKWVGIYSYSVYYDDPIALTVDKSGNVYVTGNVDPGQCTVDAYGTVKFDSTGTLKWVKTYTQGNCNWDIPASIISDTLGNIYVTGQSADNTSHENFATIKYDSNGNELWVARLNYFYNSDSQAQGVGLDNHGNVYVSGSSLQQNSSSIITAKYSYLTGIKEVENDLNIDFNVYPNPASSQLKITINTNKFKTSLITITNIVGEKVMTFIQDKPQATIDISDLSQGLYFLELNINGRTAVKKIVKE